MAADCHLLLVEARFYEDIADALAKGAIAEIERRGATYDRVAVPGCLEIPAAIAMALAAMDGDGGTRYDGFVALGCVIRGETSHYDIVAGDSARGLADLAIGHAAAIGNGIITCEDGDQAWARADPERKNKGGGAAAAALDMVELARQFGLDRA